MRIIWDTGWFRNKWTNSFDSWGAQTDQERE